MNLKPFAILMLVGVSVLSSSTQAKVARTSLEELAQLADVIVLGHDREILQSSSCKVAVFEVEETLKGDAAEAVYYVADPTWACDTAEANVGERALLFLVKPWPDNKPLVRCVEGLEPAYQVAWAGRGRMPENPGNASQVLIWVGTVALPHEVETAPGPDTSLTFIRAASLEDLINAIRISLAPAP